VEEKQILKEEHEREMDDFREKMELELAEMSGKIDRVRTDIVAQQDLYDNNAEQKISLLAAIEMIQQERQVLSRKQRINSDQLSDLKNELIARSDRVATQTAELLELKTRNDELQKWRNVMDHRLTEIKTQMEPKQKQIKDLKRQISGNETQLRVLKQSRKEDDDTQETMEQEIDELYDLIQKTENSTSKHSALIKQFKNRVHAAYTEADPALWPLEIEKIYREFVRQDRRSKEDPSYIGTLDEFERQNSALSGRASELRLKVELDMEASGPSRLQQIRKNQELIDSFEVLREENRKLKADLNAVQTTINSLTRQIAREQKKREREGLQPEIKVVCARRTPQLESAGGATPLGSARRATPLTSARRATHLDSARRAPPREGRTTRSGTSMTAEHFN
jgi:chromosome segregation ATPase